MGQNDLPESFGTPSGPPEGVLEDLHGGSGGPMDPPGPRRGPRRTLRRGPEAVLVHF